jgi:probable HAF family extracellular repeat protein
MPITFVTIDIPGATFGTYANGINDAGQIAGYYTDGSGTQGFLLSGGSLTTLNNPAVVNPPGEHYTLPWGINNSTQIAGSFNQGSSSAFLYNNGVYTTLASGGGLQGGYFGQGINDAGQVVGYSYFALGTTYGQASGFIYTNGAFTRLNDPSAVTNPFGPTGTFAEGINNAGQVVGYYNGANGTHGFLYSNGVYTTLDDPLGVDGTYATAINNTGQIAGYFIGANGYHGFVYSGGTYTTIDDPQAAGYTFVYGINDAGQVVGSYRDASGGTHGFVATLPAAPPPAGTSADMVLRGVNGSVQNGNYQIYNIGQNAILAAYPLVRSGQIGTDWTFVTLGGFNDGDTSDMLLRNSAGGAFQIYNVASNNITGSASLGTVGLDWQPSGFGNFSSLGETDMILRNSGTGGLRHQEQSDHRLRLHGHGGLELADGRGQQSWHAKRPGVAR